MSTYAQQHTTNDTYTPPSFSYPSCDIDSKQKRLASKRMEGKGSTYSPSPWPLYNYNGQSYSLRVW